MQVNRQCNADLMTPTACSSVLAGFVPVLYLPRCCHIFHEVNSPLITRSAHTDCLRTLFDCIQVVAAFGLMHIFCRMLATSWLCSWMRFVAGSLLVPPDLEVYSAQQLDFGMLVTSVVHQDPRSSLCCTRLIESRVELVMATLIDRRINIGMCCSFLGASRITARGCTQIIAKYISFIESIEMTSSC